MKKLVSIFTFLCISSVFCYSQSVVSSSGSHHEGTNATLTWSLGETITETSEGASATLTQGNQQPFNYLLVDVSEKSNDNLNISIYPNPAVNFLNISIESPKDQYNIHLHDINGKILISKTFNEDKISININDFSESLYFLKVYNKIGTEIKTYKIIKTRK